jgi:glycosyltransferase involved in cell wall biosynthesis
LFEQRTAVFLMNLVQDVNILRPLVFMATRDFGFHSVMLVSSKFLERDLYGIWAAELQILAAESGAVVHTFESDFEALQALKGSGVIFSGSESSLPAHSTTHNVFRYAPPTFLKVTLQHGFECVGFRHSPAHDRAHGQMVSFGADIVCAWQPLELLRSMAQSQRAKTLVTGPTSVLQPFTGLFERSLDAPGIVCENLHSVRLNTTSELKNEFVSAFGEFCRLLARAGMEVVLRPHPGGQYVLKNKVPLPANAVINNSPMYRLDLRQFSYGISAPSSVLIDMLLADIPTAVWRDRDGGMNVDNYAGLTRVSSPQEWLDFSREASAHPESFVELQRHFLAEQQIPISPREVFHRFAEIFDSVRRSQLRCGTRAFSHDRFIFVANARLPTLEVCLERPLMPLINSGDLATELLTETELRARERDLESKEAVIAWLDNTLDRFAPDALIFSRYSGPFAREMLAWARRSRIPVVYQIDDDLLAVPKDLGPRKHAYHNASDRLDAVRTLLAGSDLVYASTERLRERLLGYFPESPIIAGAINCSGRIVRPPELSAASVVGYMASADHLPNLMMVLPAVERLLERHPQLSFELFGSIPVPERLQRFKARVRQVPPVLGYDGFIHELAKRRWDVGICPLTPTAFNLTKSNNKWVEYTSAGIAVVASANMIYDECCAGDCGILARTNDEWFAALERLVTDDLVRREMVARAQRKLEATYSIDKHREQILNVIALAKRTVARCDASQEGTVEEVA